MATTVPLRIHAGPTCYEHFTVGKKDLYAPDFLLPNPPPIHTWRYGVAAEQGNTVFFYNEATKKSVWVLPVVDPVSGTTRSLSEAESMRAEGKATSAKLASASASVAGSRTTEKNDTKPVLKSRPATGEKPELESMSKNGAAPSSPTPSPASSRSSTPKAREEVQEAVRNREETKRDIEAAVQRALLAKTQSDRGGGPNLESKPEVEAGDRKMEDAHRQLSVEERLAAYRARKQGAASALPTATFNPQDASQATREATNPQDTAREQPSVTTTSPPTTAPPAEHKAPAAPQVVVSPTVTGDLSAFVESLYAARDMERVRAAEAVQREKLAALEEERLAYERHRQRQLQDEAEEEERLRMLRARRLAEASRLQRQKEASVNHTTLNRSAEDPLHGDAEEASALDAVNAFFAKQSTMLDKVRSSQERVPSVEASIAEALARSTINQSPQPTSTRQDATMTAERTDTKNTKRSGAISMLPSGSHRGQEALLDSAPRSHRESGTIDYGGAFRYVGDITTSGTAPHGAPRIADRPPETKGDMWKGANASGTIVQKNGQPGVEKTGNTTTGLASLLSSTPAAQELPLRQGQGTIQRLIHIEQKRSGFTATQDESAAATDSHFTGTWVEDERQGPGVLSLPNTLVEGHWRQDSLVPGSRALLQTRRLKGAVTVGPGKGATTTRHASTRLALAGPAKLELSNGARVTGFVTPSDAKEPSCQTLGGGPCVIDLPSKDRVEWWSASNAAHTGNQHHPKKKTSTFVDPAVSSAQERGTGQCRVSFHNGDLYIGSVAHFQLHGYGRYEFHDTGNVYVGFFYKGFMQGEGSYSFADGDVYIGDFHEGAFHGIGCYVHKDAYMYEGEWRRGQMHGKGLLTFANGDQWKGVFEKDKRLTGKYLRFALN